MPLVLITGRSGTGKSAVRDELASRGFIAYGTDEDEISRWFENDSGRMVDNPSREIWTTPQWQTTHTWAMRVDRLEEIAERAREHTVFVCGVAANESEVLHLFSSVICLYVLDENVVRARIDHREDNEFGKAPQELEAILAEHRRGAPCQGLAARTIDASQPLRVVVDEVLRAVSDQIVIPTHEGC